MRRFVKWLLVLVVVLTAVIVGGSFFLPSTVRVTRSIEIDAPPEAVFAYVSDLNHFNDFSPWVAADPAATYSVAGGAGSVGQKLSWASTDSDIGVGSMTITSVEPPTRVTLDLDFGQMGKADCVWDIAPTADGAKVTWTFHTETRGVLMRWTGVLFGRWIGSDYERGLARLKLTLEQP